MEASITAAVVLYHFPLDFLLKLDVFSLNRLMDASRLARNMEISESAIAMRNAMNADKKEFEKFLDHYSSEAPEDQNARKVAEGIDKAKRLFGGS